MKPSLYLVATPIGNLSDFSDRARQILSEVDFVAAEDTRKTGILLKYFGIKKPLISYFEHNIAERGEVIVARLLQGQTCALVSDAGMPAISDPGEVLVRQCMERGLVVSAVPGPCAAVTALAMSGLSTKRFCFEGFLSTARNSRMKHLQSLKHESRTMIFYEAPHKLCGTIADLYEVFGDRRVSFVREITKIYEQTLLTTLSQAIAFYQENPPRGEFVVIVEGESQEELPAYSPDTIRQMFEECLAQGMKKTAAAKQVAEQCGLSKREVYDMFKGEGEVADENHCQF